MKLYFDFINQNKTVAITEKSKNVTYNLNQINLNLAERFTDVIASNNAGTTIFPLNQFICIVSLSLDQKIYEMVVVDLRDNIEAAVDYSANIDNEAARQIFMNCFNEIRGKKFEPINNLEMVVGDAPEDPLSP